LEAVSLVAGFITIVRAVAEVFKKFKKHEEAKALEKAADAIQAGSDLREAEAKEILAQTLTKELGKDKARPIIEYTEVVEVFFPFRPIGTVLEYGIAIKRLVLQIHEALSKIQAFKRIDSRLELPKTSRAFTGILKNTPLLPVEGVLSVHIVEHLRGVRGSEGKPLSDYLDLHVEIRSALGLKAFEEHPVLVDADKNAPFSLLFKGLGTEKAVPLNASLFQECMEYLLDDTKFYVQKMAKEVEESREAARKLSLFTYALKELPKYRPARPLD